MGVRSFIAIELPEDLKHGIFAATEKLRALNSDVKWVSLENLHLTVKFLGDTAEEMLENISKRLLSISERHAPFLLNFIGAGSFPDMRKPRVIWIGISESREFMNLHNDIENAMTEFGFQKDNRRFSLHLTIGRVRSLKNVSTVMKEFSTLEQMDFGKIEVKNIALMKSDLRPNGSVYTSLQEISFRR